MTVRINEEILQDVDIIGTYDTTKVIITPLLDISEESGDNQIGSAGIDLRLDTRFKRVLTQKMHCIDPQKKYHEQDLYEIIEIDMDDEKDVYILHPGDFVLSQSLEYIRLPNNFVATVDGRSGLGRLGLIVQTAGWVDPGFQGHLVFELCNLGSAPIILRPFIRIARLTLIKTSLTKRPYKGKYQYQVWVKGIIPDVYRKEGGNNERK